MQTDFINPVIQATVDTFTMMVGIKPQRTEVIVKRGALETYGLSGIIVLSGKVNGAMVLNMPEDVALNVASSFTGEDVRSVTAEVLDAIAELTNIVAGDTKTRLHEKGYEFGISLPRVVLGRNLVAIGSPGVPWVVISFRCEAGEFTLEVSMAEQAAVQHEHKEE